VEDNLHLQQSIDDNDNADESSEKGLFTALKREETTTSSASSSIAKIKRKPKQAKAPTKTPPVSEKQSVYTDYSKEDNQVPKKAKMKHVLKCPYAMNHKKKELTGLSEEQIVANLEKGYLLGAKCSLCNKVIVNKTRLTDQEAATETIFNSKSLLFSCDNYKAAMDIPCIFCMCLRCFVDISINYGKDNNEGARRSSRRK